MKKRSKKIYKYLLDHSGELITFVPFLLSAGIKIFGSHFQISIDTFDFCDLAITNGLICILYQQNLIKNSYSLINEDDKSDKNHYANLFVFFSVISVSLFTLLGYMEASCEIQGFEVDTIQKIFIDALILFFAIITKIATNSIEQSLKINIGI